MQALKEQITTLRAKVKSFHYSAFSHNPRVNSYVFERFPGLAASFPAMVTFKVAISMDVLAMITRAARTAQSSKDLENMFLEFRSLRNATARLVFYQRQRLAGATPHSFVSALCFRSSLSLPSYSPSPHLPHLPHLPHPVACSGVAASDVQHYSVGISSISDNYITDVINAFHETHLPYILQWSEQNIALDTVAADHHGVCWFPSFVTTTCRITMHRPTVHTTPSPHSYVPVTLGMPLATWNRWDTFPPLPSPSLPSPSPSVILPTATVTPHVTPTVTLAVREAMGADAVPGRRAAQVALHRLQFGRPVCDCHEHGGLLDDGLELARRPPSPPPRCCLLGAQAAARGHVRQPSERCVGADRRSMGRRWQA